MSLRFVAISPYDPYATCDHAGGAYFQRVLTEWQKQGWQVTTIAPAESRNATQACANGPMGSTFLLEGEPSRRRSVKRILRNLSTGQSELLGKAWLRSLPRRVAETILEADLIDLEWPESYRLAPALRALFPAKPIISTVHDIGYQKARRVAQQSRRTYPRVRNTYRYLHARRNDQLAFQASDLILAFNPRDEVLVNGLGVQTPVRLAPALVERRDQLSACPEAKRALFVGAMHRPENAEAIRWFLDMCWPLVLADHPSARIRVAGSDPPEWLLTRADAGLEVTGFMNDILDAYQDVSVIIAPILLGAGLKFKVAQALVLGFPIVGTSVALEGVNELLGSQLLSAYDTPEDFAKALSNTFADGFSWSMGHLAEFRDVFDFDAQLAAMVTGIREFFQGRTREIS